MMWCHYIVVTMVTTVYLKFRRIRTWWKQHSLTVCQTLPGIADEMETEQLCSAPVLSCTGCVYVHEALCHLNIGRWNASWICSNSSPGRDAYVLKDIICYISALKCCWPVYLYYPELLQQNSNPGKTVRILEVTMRFTCGFNFQQRVRERGRKWMNVTTLKHQLISERFCLMHVDRF